MMTALDIDHKDKWLAHTAVIQHRDRLERLMAYQDLYLRHLRARSEFPLCAKAIEEPDCRPFGFAPEQLEKVKREWRREFGRRM